MLFINQKKIMCSRWPGREDHDHGSRRTIVREAVAWHGFAALYRGNATLVSPVKSVYILANWAVAAAHGLVKSAPQSPTYVYCREIVALALTAQQFNPAALGRLSHAVELLSWFPLLKASGELAC